MGSTLDPKNFPGTRRKRKSLNGHDTRALGPSDSSDTGSDMAGPGTLDDDLLHLDRGTNQDTEAGDRDAGDAGPNVGDLDLDDNTDRHGTGEHLTAGKDPRIGVNADRDAVPDVAIAAQGIRSTLDELAVHAAVVPRADAVSPAPRPDVVSLATRR